MKKGKSRNKRKKTRSRLLWIAIAVIGIAAVISAVWIRIYNPIIRIRPEYYLDSIC